VDTNLIQGKQHQERKPGFTIDASGKTIDFKTIVKTAIKNNANAYLNPPISNLAYRGIQKLGKELTKWLDMTKNPEQDLVLSAELMEGAGTDGALFRNFYRDFSRKHQQSVMNWLIWKSRQWNFFIILTHREN
jgi:hypothetical protein